jgi:hypothetical protein
MPKPNMYAFLQAIKVNMKVERKTCTMMGEECPPSASHKGGVDDVEMYFETFSIEPNLILKLL